LAAVGIAGDPRAHFLIKRHCRLSYPSSAPYDAASAAPIFPLISEHQGALSCLHWQAKLGATAWRKRASPGTAERSCRRVGLAARRSLVDDRPATATRGTGQRRRRGWIRRLPKRL